MRLRWRQIKEESREPKPYERPPPNQMPGIEALDIEHVERDERCDRQYAESHRERVDNRHIPRRGAGSKEEHHAQHKRRTTHLLQCKRSRVEISASGGCRNRRAMSSLLLIRSTPPATMSTERKPSTIRSAR